jgi:hypothetical protein
MKTRQTLPVMIALVAVLAVAFSPMAQAVETNAVSDRLAADTANRPQVHFAGTTEGWAIIGGQAHVSEIVLDGNAVRTNNGVWKVTADAEITAADRHATLELKGNAADGKIRLHGTGTLDSGESFRIVLRGHYTPVFDEPGLFVMAFSTAKIHSVENDLRIPLIQSGIVKVEAVNPATTDYEKFVEEFTVQ